MKKALDQQVKEIEGLLLNDANAAEELVKYLTPYFEALEKDEAFWEESIPCPPEEEANLIFALAQDFANGVYAEEDVPVFSIPLLYLNEQYGVIHGVMELMEPCAVVTVLYLSAIRRGLLVLASAEEDAEGNMVHGFPFQLPTEDELEGDDDDDDGE